MSSLSIVGICQDEADVIGAYLECCLHTFKSLKEDLHEVVLVDGGSKDNTIDVINSYKDKLPITLIEYPFDTFGQQKNRALDKATGDYIFGPDTDMSWTTNFPDVFKSGLYAMEPYWNFRIIFMFDDAYHYFYKWNTNVNIRLWKRGPKYATYFHEQLEGSNSPSTPVDQQVLLFENSFRQSDAALLNRGQRYQKFQAQMQAAGVGPGEETRYLGAARSPEVDKHPLPPDLAALVLPSTNFNCRPGWKASI